MSTYVADAAEDLSVDGPSATFAYRRMGPRGGIPLVLLNRVRATIDWWDPEFLDYLSADHDVIVFDNIGTGYTDGTPRDSVEGFAAGAIEFIEALALTKVDLLGWTLGGTVAQHVILRRPDLVRKLVVAAASPGGQVPGAPPPSEKVRAIMAQAEVSAYDMVVVLQFPDRDAVDRWYQSPEYQAIVSLRTSSTIADVVIIDGVPEGFSAAAVASSLRADLAGTAA